ncbi:hypothetical protein B0H14DRAFT_2643145 [Mycena olivaceomarginata]|nr:hypothetical protein B0H14DRAFT_2643145 [Mycena olivaceomarginata]
MEEEVPHYEYECGRRKKENNEHEELEGAANAGSQRVMSECGEGGDCLSLGYNGTDGVRTVWTAIWIWWLLSGPVFYRAKLAKMVVLIEEAWGREKGAQDEVQVWGKAGSTP